MLVDDDRGLLKVTSMQLRQLTDKEVLAFASPSEALDWIRGNPGVVECLITDRHMPGMSGEELLSHVCETEPAVKAVVVTGDPTGLASALNHHALSAEILQKPADLSQFEEAIECAPGLGDRREILELWGTAREVSEPAA